MSEHILSSDKIDASGDEQADCDGSVSDCSEPASTAGAVSSSGCSARSRTRSAEDIYSEQKEECDETNAPESVRGFLLDCAAHEVGAHLIFTENGLTPFFALDAVVKRNDGAKREVFEHDGEEWVASLSFSECGFAPREDPDFTIENVREYELHLTPMNDEVGERKAHYNVSPRWPNMVTEEGKEVDTPNIEGVNVTAQGTNISIDAYPTLLRQAMGALDINGDYFADIHRYSNIFAFEQYVRVRRDKSGRIFGTGSPMRRIFEYVDGHGKFRELREDDRKGVEGYHHRTRFDSAGSAALIPGHGYGKRIKHYHPEHPRSDPSDPLYHPKVGVSIQTDLNTDGAVPWADRGELREELDETLLNLLSWSGLPTRPNGETYVEDAYFTPTDSARSVTLIEDPTPGMEYEQLEVALSTLFGDPEDPDDEGLNATEREAARVLADGGEQDVSALAEAIGRSKRTMYRVLDALSEVATNRNGTVGFASDYLAEQFAALLGGASAKARIDGESGGSSPWAAFLARYGPEVSELFPDTDAGNIELRFGVVDPETDMKAILRKGLEAWMRSGGEKRKFVAGAAHWIQDGEKHQEGGKFGTMDLPLLQSARVRALD